MTDSSGRRPHAGRAARAHRRARRRTCRRAAAALARAAAANSATAGIVIVDVADLSQARPRVAAGLFPAARLPRADAARGRSRPSVPVHSQSRLHARAATRPSRGRAADERAGALSQQGRAVHEAARRERGGRAALRRARTGHRRVQPRCCFPASRSSGTAASASSATATSKWRKRPRIWCGCSKAR